MGLNEDLGDRENVGSAAVSTQRAREKKERLDVGSDGLCRNCGFDPPAHVFFIFCPRGAAK